MDTEQDEETTVAPSEYAELAQIINEITSATWAMGDARADWRQRLNETWAAFKARFEAQTPAPPSCSGQDCAKGAPEYPGDVPPPPPFLVDHQTIRASEEFRCMDDAIERPTGGYDALARHYAWTAFRAKFADAVLEEAPAPPHDLVGCAQEVVMVYWRGYKGCDVDLGKMSVPIGALGAALAAAVSNIEQNTTHPVEVSEIKEGSSLLNSFLFYPRDGG